MAYKKSLRLLWFSALCFLLMSMSFLMMIPLDISETADKILKTIAGICFWIFLILGAVLQVVLTGKSRKLYKTNRQKKHVRPIGLLAFFRGREGTIADCALIIGVIGLALSNWLTNGVGAICYVFLALVIFSFAAHCIFNGRNYYYLSKAEYESKKPRFIKSRLKEDMK